MTDQPGADPRYAAQAAQAVGAVQNSDQGTDAGVSVEEMQAQAVRAAMTDYEQRLKDMMAAAESQSAAWAKQFDAMQRQLASVRAQAGPPVATLLADSVATRLDSIAKANPDLGAQHFAGVVSQAQLLAEEVKAVAGGGGDLGRAEQLVHAVDAWFHRVHPRASGKVLEGAHAAVDELERILDELPALAGAAAAVVQAV